MDTTAQGFDERRQLHFLNPGLRAFRGQVFRFQTGDKDRKYMAVSIVGSETLTAQAIVEGLPSTGLKFVKKAPPATGSPNESELNYDVAGGNYNVTEVWTTPIVGETVEEDVASITQGEIRSGVQSTKILILECHRFYGAT